MKRRKSTKITQPNWIKYPAAKSLVDEEVKKTKLQRELDRITLNLAKGFRVDAVNAAPVADLWIPEAHDVIGDRAFASQPEEVATYARACADGLGKAGDPNR